MTLEDHGIMRYNVICVKPDEVGYANSWADYAQINGQLPVFRFRGRINFDEFRNLIKELSIKIGVRSLENINVQVQVPS
jgi:hypothetical protein